MPPFPVLLGSWRLDPVALTLAAVATGLYLWGVARVRARGLSWPPARTAAFLGLGIGSYLVVCLGFLGAFSTELRFAFSTRTALLLFVVPALLALGRPLTLARRALDEPARARVERLMDSRFLRVLGSAMVSPIVAVLVFSVFLTPLAGILRATAVGQGVVTALVPALGLVLVIPLIEAGGSRTGFFVTVEFLLAFVELVMDAIPGIVIRLSGGILDGVHTAVGSGAAWFPSPLRDQQLSGDLLWFIAEIADIPVLVLLFVRWARVDRGEARGFDQLSDEEMAELTRQHLRGRRD
ncbi:cytochrome c oxidase assembly protein [Galbitalea soli]|uniref:Cytochrome c oxidase assembly protein n=2 Tax=Galbitalea soli TaxID=1268042 RepID=A0A7C9TPI2_9MICO|nr:cytochrome c oxidase assembly protein [Galbitalea soli]NEM89964.1 cytochrome c oxidase assembly protein [Galbitalea soli]NYJ30670.1 cytochrome c oxidase assembly factor CtaG [Galbitalea soli]